MVYYDGLFIHYYNKQKNSETNSMPDGDGGKTEEPWLQSQEGQELSASAGPRQLNLKMASEHQKVIVHAQTSE